MQEQYQATKVSRGGTAQGQLLPVQSAVGILPTSSVLTPLEPAMPEVTGIDHIYITTSDLSASERFYDLALVKALDFQNNSFELGGDPHIQYFCRHFGFVLRPARVAAKHEPYAPGLHHFCLRVDSASEVEEAAANLRALGIDASPAKLYPEYAPDYVATFFKDPDGLRLEVTNYRQERRQRHDQWNESAT
jgi:catechol 2,3-dioxygenase-like lactoylglutathione lyase family enzyme